MTRAAGAPGTAAAGFRSAVPDDPRFTAGQRAALERIEAAPDAPESFDPIAALRRVADLTVLLDQLDAARAKATPGEWEQHGGDPSYVIGAVGHEDGEYLDVADTAAFRKGSAQEAADAACIVAAVNALPRLTAALRAVLALHVPWYEINGVRHDHTVTATCADFDRCDGDAEHECDDPDEHERLACNECRDVFEDIDGYLFWPCPTVTAIASAVAEEGQ